MTLIKRPVLQDKTITWAADNGGESAELQTSGGVTRIEAEVELVPSATLTGANQPDGLGRIVQNLRIVGDGNTYFNLPADDGCQGGNLLRLLNRLDWPNSVGHGNGAIAAPARTFTGIRFVLHCGGRRWDPYDLSAFIPAGNLGALQAFWHTSGSDVLDDTVTVSSAVMRFLTYRVAGNYQEVMGEIARQGFGAYPRAINQAPSADAVPIMVPRWTPKKVEHTAATNDYITDYDTFVNGGYCMRFSALFQDATATRPARAGDEGTRMQIYELNSDAPIWNKTIEMVQGSLPHVYNVEADDAAQDFQGGAAQGLTYADFREQFDPVYGLNLQETKRTWRAGHLISEYTSGDDRLIMQEGMVPQTLSMEEFKDTFIR